MTYNRGRRDDQRGSVLVMATVLSFAMFLVGLTYLSSIQEMQNEISFQVSDTQQYYARIAAAATMSTEVRAGRIRRTFIGNWQNYYGQTDFRGSIELSGYEQYDYELTQGYTIKGEGRSTFYGWDGQSYGNIRLTFDLSTFADYLYLTDKERDPYRDSTVWFWTPDTLDGKVHSNDTLHIDGSPRFMKPVSSSAPVMVPYNNNAHFDDPTSPHLRATRIYFPDQAEEIRRYSGYRGWGTAAQDSATEITFSGPYIYKRSCGIDEEDSTFHCFPQYISEAYRYVLPASGALFIEGKVIVKADRGGADIYDPSFVSLGFQGRLTLASSDTMIIPDNLIYRYSRPNNSVPDTISDVLGLISENYIMIGEDVADTVYVNAAMAAINGAITVQDIYDYGAFNEKQSLFIYGSLAQRNRGLVHSSFGGGRRGFIEKDYHYDTRLAKHPPPHFLPTNKHQKTYYEAFYDEG